MFACAPLMVFTLYGLTMMSVRPQLRQIYHVLNNIAMTRLQDGFQVTSNFRLVQHISGACRAASSMMESSLSSCQLLLLIDDVDEEKCRHKRKATLHFLVTAVIGFVGFCAMFGDTVGSSIMYFFIPTMWQIFVVANTMGSISAEPWMILAYCILGVFLVWKMGFLDDAILQLKLKFFTKNQLEHWKKSERMEKILKRFSISYQFKRLKRRIWRYLRSPEKFFDELFVSREIKLRRTAVWLGMNR